MNHLLSRRAFSASLAAAIPAILLGKTAASQSLSLVPNAAGTDLESVFLRVTPYYLRDVLLASTLATPDGEEYRAVRWENVSSSPYLSSVGGVNILPAAGSADADSVVGAYGIYLAPAGALAGLYLGRRALEDATTEVVAQDIDGYSAETLVYNDGSDHTLTQVAVGNVVVLGYDLETSAGAGGEELASVANAGLLVRHLRDTFQAVR